LRVAIGATIVGYALTLIAMVFEVGIAALTTSREPYVIAVGMLAAFLERRDRRKTAAWLILGTLWFELHFTLVVSGVRSTAVIVIPLLTLGATLMLGSRPAVVAATCSACGIPAALALRAGLGLGPFLPTGDLTFFVVLEIAIVTTAVMVSLLMKAFSRAMLSAGQNAQRARELIDGAPDAIIALNQHGLIEDCNPKAEVMLGLGREQVVGTHLSDLGLRDISSRQQQTRPSIDTLSDEPREYRAVKSGLMLEGLLRTVPRADGESGALIILRDITQRKKAEERAKELQHQLQHAQKLEAIGQLAGGVAHDINNLLTAVGGYGDLLLHHEQPLVREMASELCAARDRGTGLTRQLLAFARKELALPRGLDLAVTLRGLERLLRRLGGEQVNITVETDEPAVIYADPGQLEQVVLNLVMNARDAILRAPRHVSPQGMVRVSCHRDQRTDRVELRVEDTGSGMSAATQRRVFEPFFTTKPRGEGTGLGLSTVHGIVESSSGSITVSSELGRGTTFTLSWPAHEAVDADERRPTRAPSLDSRRGRILLVEDDIQNRRFLAQLLGTIGYQVTVAEDAAEALSAYWALESSGSPPDVLLTDVRMPGMNGIDLATQLRRKRPLLPVLFVSGYLDQTLESTEFDAVKDLLLKPFTTEVLLERLERKLGRAGSSSATMLAQRDRPS
jgi:PAS domain S-box-containing protein